MDAKHLTSGTPSFDVEALEERRLLSVGNVNWAPFPKLIGQDLETTNFPAVDGTGMNIAIVDHGIDYTHPNIGGGAGVGPFNRVIFAQNFTNNSTADPDTMDYDGHGTGVSGIIGEDPISYGGAYDQGIALGSKQLSLKTGDEGDPRSQQHIKDALDWIIGHYGKYHIWVVNLTDFVGSGNSPPIFAAELKTLHDLGIFIASPVGNTPGEAIGYPAADPNVFGVGGISDDNTFFFKTQTGPALDILAPGNSVLMTYDDYSKPPGQRQIVTPYAQGTSFATAHVDALALLIKQVDPTTSADEVMKIMQDSGDSVSGSNVKRINLNSAVALTFQRREDVFAGANNRGKRAAPIPIGKNGVGSIAHLKLLMGDTKWHYFTTATTAKVTVGFVYQRQYATYPQGGVQLLDKFGSLVANIGPEGYAGTLPAGTYYVVAAAGSQTLVGSYGIVVSATKVTARRVAGAANALPATSAVRFSTTAITTSSVLSGADTGWEPGAKKTDA